MSGLHARGEGERVLALESWEGTRASRRVEEGLSRSFSGGGGKPSCPSPSAGDLRELPRVPLRGEGSCGGGGAPRDSAGSGATEEGLTSRGGRNLRLPLRFGLRPQGPCRVGTGESGLVLSEEGNSACLSNCSGCLTHLVKLCVETAGFSGRRTGVSVPLRMVTSPTGLPSKRCPGIGFLSRAEWEIGVFRHVAPPKGLRLEFPREAGLILRCTGNVGNPFQTKQGNQPSCPHQERRKFSDEVVPGNSEFPSG